jgi:hypothetical protein
MKLKGLYFKVSPFKNSHITNGSSQGPFFTGASLPLIQHDPGLLLDNDEAYALSHTRISYEPPRAAVFHPNKGGS